MASGKKEPLSVRFPVMVNKNGPKAVDHDGNKIGRCWEWTGYRQPGGYGMVGLDENNSSGKRKSCLAHRAAWFLKFGVWPTGHLDHLCSNRACVRPKHLEDVTQRENNLRSPRPRATHCPAGHEMSDDNIYQRVRGTYIARQCKTCAKDRAAARRRAQ